MVCGRVVVRPWLFASEVKGPDYDIVPESVFQKTMGGGRTFEQAGLKPIEVDTPGGGSISGCLNCWIWGGDRQEKSDFSVAAIGNLLRFWGLAFGACVLNSVLACRAALRGAVLLRRPPSQAVS